MLRYFCSFSKFQFVNNLNFMNSINLKYFRNSKTPKPVKTWKYIKKYKKSSLFLNTFWTCWQLVDRILPSPNFYRITLNKSLFINTKNINIFSFYCGIKCNPEIRTKNIFFKSKTAREKWRVTWNYILCPLKMWN